MNLLPLHYFMVVVENEGISKAARALQVTQQTLSIHIANLEKELSCCLFLRRPHFKLTYEGERLYQYAQQITSTHEALIQEFNDLAHAEINTIKIGVAHTRGRVIMPPILEEILKEEIPTQISLCEQSNDELLASLVSQNIDVAIARIPQITPEITVKELYQETMILVARKDILSSPKPSLTDFNSVPFLLCNTDDIAGRAAEIELKKAGIVPSRFIRSNNIETLVELCLRGMGACFCPDNLLTKAMATKDLSQFFILPVGKPYSISIAHLQKPYTPKIVEHIEAIAQEVLGSLYRTA